MVLLIALITELFPMGWIGKRLLMLATAVVIFLVFSVWKRALGISGAKTKLSRKTGIPTTRGGLERKVGKMVINALFGKKK